MSRRRLSEQQRRRIAQQQTARLRHHTVADTPHPTDVQGYPGRVIANFGQQLEVEVLAGPRLGEVLRCHQRSNLPPLVSGDRVVWQAEGEEQGVVVALDPRTTVFTRPGFGRELRPVAANIDEVLVVFAPVPPPHQNLIDRYLVAIEALGMAPRLVLNKADLVQGGAESEDLEALLTLYAALAYPVHRVSARDGTGVLALREAMHGATAVIVGQSGVGKSSLINALSPAVSAAVGALSESMDKGTHTTTAARLFHADGFDLIDSPGIREFSLWHLAPQEILHGFREFRPWLGNCRFRDCRHQQEPGCAVRAAVADGKIDPRRLQSCLQILQSVEGDWSP